MRKFSRWVRNRWKCWHLIRAGFLGQINGSRYLQDSAVKKPIMVWWQPWDTICNFSSLPMELGGIPATSSILIRAGGTPRWALLGVWMGFSKRPKIITQIQCFYKIQLNLGLLLKEAFLERCFILACLHFEVSSLPTISRKCGFLSQKTDGKCMECMHYL